VLSKFTKKDETLRTLKEVFHNGGFLNPVLQEVNVLSKENTEEELSDSEEEWKSYLNDSGYISQEELYTPFCPPSEKSKGVFQPNNKKVIPPIPAEVWDTLGQPSGKFDFLVKYTAPESSKISIEDIQPTGWGDPFEYNSQPEEAYMPSRLSHPFEVTEDLSFIVSAKADKPEVIYSHINAIFGDDWEDVPIIDQESVSDNESLHPEDWELHPEDPGHVPPKVTCASPYTPRSVEEAEEDRLSTTNGQVDNPGPSNHVRPTVNVIIEDDPKGKMPEYIVCRGVRCYWTAVEVPTVVHRSK
jgi:hypothetical protein